MISYHVVTCTKLIVGLLRCISKVGAKIMIRPVAQICQIWNAVVLLWISPSSVNTSWNSKSHAFQISDRGKISEFRSGWIWNAVNLVKIWRFWVKNSDSGAFQIQPDLNYFVTLRLRIISTLVVDSMRLTQWLMHYRGSISMCTSHNVCTLYISSWKLKYTVQ
jgi:hypothetical protein